MTLEGESVTDAAWTPYLRDTDRSAPRALTGRSVTEPLSATCRE